MQEVFYEEAAIIQDEKAAKIKYNVFKGLSIFSYVLMAVWIIVVFYGFEFGKGSILLNIIFALIPLGVFFASGFVLGRMKNKFYVDYDYTVVSGSVRFAKVIKNIKRRFIDKFECSDIEKLGKYGSDTYNKYEMAPGIIKQVLTSNMSPCEGKDFYYLVVNVSGFKKLYVLECSETFMVNILKFAKKTIVEEDFK